MTAEHVAIQISGHQPGLFTTQKEEILNLLLRNRGNWVPAYALAGVALQYSSRIFSLRREGYQIQNKTTRVAGKVHGAFRLIALPGETGEPNGDR